MISFPLPPIHHHNPSSPHTHTKPITSSSSHHKIPHPPHLTTQKMSTTTRSLQPNIAIHTNPEHELHILEQPVPVPKRNECLIHIRATGICGSDVHFWEHGKIGSSLITGSQGLGHESAGEVVGVGEDVKGLKIGKSSRVESSRTCGGDPWEKEEVLLCVLVSIIITVQ